MQSRSIRCSLDYRQVSWPDVSNSDTRYYSIWKHETRRETRVSVPTRHDVSNDESMSRARRGPYIIAPLMFINIEKTLNPNLEP